MAESVTPSMTFDPDTMTLTAQFDPYSEVAGLHAGINLMLSPYSVGESESASDPRPVLTEGQQSRLAVMALYGMHFMDAEQVLPRVRRSIATDETLKSTIELETDTAAGKLETHPRVIIRRDTATNGPWTESSIRNLAALFVTAYTESVDQNLDIETLRQYS